MKHAKAEILTHRALIFAAALFALFVFGVNAQQVSNESAGEKSSEFRVEKIPVQGGAELITIFAKMSVAGADGEQSNDEIPIVSVLRDTLGDEIRENDRLRWTWTLSYARPSFWQKVTGLMPFIYAHTTNKTSAGSGPPPPVADMLRSNKSLWNQLLWMTFRRIVLSEVGVGPKASVAQYHKNAQDHRRLAVSDALTILSLYEATEGEKILSDTELRDIQARLMLTDKPLGWHVQDENLLRVYEKEVAKARDIRGHNWELLRQYAEAEGLYFDPMPMPDGVARHAMLWVAAEDLAENRDRKFDARFLNIKNPWNDKKIADWKGYKEVRWFDEESRIVDADTPNARPRTLIPLALYGLDHPKVPIILVDFRDSGNPHRREITKRLLSDLTGNVLSISKFSSMPYFFGRFIYDFVTGRRGMDINQPSRMRSYAQLKMLLALDNSLDRELRDELATRIERVSMNPLDNDLVTEIRLAKQQYQNLIEYAKRPDGLPAKLDLERRQEMMRVAHNDKEQFLFKTMHVVTFGLYTHREKPSPELVARMDIRRQLEFHERNLREIAFKSANPEIDSDVDALRKSLQFIADNGADAKVKNSKALAKIFRISVDGDLQSMCLAGLYRINNSSAKNELLAIYEDQKIAEVWRAMCAKYLRKALDEGQRISRRDAAAIAGIVAFN